MIKILSPLEESILRLSTNDTKLMEGALLVEFITESLKEDRSALSAVILQQLEEIWEKRYNNKIFQPIKFLDEGKGVVDPGFLYENYSRLFLGGESLEEEKEVDENNKIGLRSSKFDMFLDRKMQKKINVNIPVDIDMSTIHQEISNFRINKLRGAVLEKLYSVFKSVRPANFESERVFSHCGIIITKRRKRMSANLLDNIIFLKYIFKKNLNKLRC